MKKILLLLFVMSLALPAHGVTRIYDRSTGDIVDADKDDAEWDNTNSAINTHIADTSAHDATGGVVGVSKVQTLTNKSLTSPTITGSPTAAGATWANLGTATIFAATSASITNATITNATITNLTGNVSANSGVILSFFSGVADNLMASINGATGKIIGFLLERGTYNINLVAATTTNANDSIKVQCGGAACSVTNPGFVVIGSTTAGGLTGFVVTSDVTLLLTGVTWGFDSRGAITGGLARMMFVNDNGTLRTCAAYLGGRDGGSVLTTDTNATQASVNLPEEILCNTAVGSATNVAMEFGYARWDFTDATDVFAIQTGVNDIVTGKNADGISQSWNPGPTGFSAEPTVGSARFVQHERFITIQYAESAVGTSDQTYYRINLPAKALTGIMQSNGGQVTNNSSLTSVAPGILSSTASVVLNLYRTAGTDTWTNSGTKGIGGFTFTYEIGPAASFPN